MNSAEYLCCNCEMKFIEPVMIMDTRRGEETPCCPRCQSRGSRFLKSQREHPRRELKLRTLAWKLAMREISRSCSVVAVVKSDGPRKLPPAPQCLGAGGGTGGRFPRCASVCSPSATST